MFNPKIPAIFQALSFSKALGTEVGKSVELSQSDYQRLASILKEKIHETHLEIVNTKVETKVYWELSDKNDPTTTKYYECFCESNRDKKKAQKQLANLEALQSKIKQAMKGN